MGDMADDFRALKQYKKEQKADRRAQNMEYLSMVGAVYETHDSGTSLLFRSHGLKADFYPGTGRWRSGGTTFRGGAKAFWGWWQKYIKEQEGHDERAT